MIMLFNDNLFCYIFLWLLCLAARRAAAGKFNAPEIIIDALNTYPSNHILTAVACRALAAVVHDDGGFVFIWLLHVCFYVNVCVFVSVEV